MTEDAQSCSNASCPGRDQPLSATAGFDLLVDFTDHTGTLQACSLRSPVAEKTLGCTVGTISKDQQGSASTPHAAAPVFNNKINATSFLPAVDGRVHPSDR